MTLYPAGDSGGFYRTPLLKSSVHVNCVYVGHTHLIENSTHFRKKEPPCMCLKLGTGLQMENDGHGNVLELIPMSTSLNSLSTNIHLFVGESLHSHILLLRQVDGMAIVSVM